MAHCGHHTSHHSRRELLTRTSLGLGAMSLGSLLNESASGSGSHASGILDATHLAPKAKRVIYLLQSGAPTQIETYDYKPKLREMTGKELPDSARQGQRLTGMTSGQVSLPLVGSIYKFAQHGASGMWISELFPHTAGIVDECCFVRSMFTEAINHDPAVMFFQTGSQFPGRPAIGAWLSYGLGSLNENLPDFVVLVTKEKTGQPLYSRSWGNGFLPSEHQGVQFRPGRDPVLYLTNPQGMSVEARRQQLDQLRKLHVLQFNAFADPEINARIAQYEMAFRMQTSVPEATDLSSEPEHIFKMYGEDARDPGTYAANCLLARRLIERDVRFVQLYHRGWDHHGNLPEKIKQQATETDQASAALVTDLKQRGLLDETLVIWGGEFGRTCYSQGKLTATDYGRDHHPRCFTIWMAGGGSKKSTIYGRTDDFAYNIVENPLHVHDFQATVLHLLGIDHERLTYKFQGRRYRLTDVHGDVVNDIVS